MQKGISNTWLGIGALVVLVLIVGMYVVGITNGEVKLDNDVRAQFANIETQYQRRFDLIPNLVNTVQGVAGFEQETLTELTRLRSQWQTAPTSDAKVQAANQLESTISKLLLITENYPQLQATQSFQDLMVQLEGTENRISVERTRYNDKAREYNTYIKVFPNSIFLGGKTEKPYFQAAAGAENPPVVPTDFTP
ncbi:MAG: LemA family protein [Candidatus Iainarchaeum archaeon]|uniref:LemA family protein n=1 Tax=Candidatus Iainarchaeum sp. TaxID=3101447 RepID=A0A7T9DKF5_9ARCH|nr:MAG: LemA family protein [Candidatus Diapherotrites archaeon]